MATEIVQKVYFQPAFKAFPQNGTFEIIFNTKASLFLVFTDLLPLSGYWPFYFKPPLASPGPEG